MPKYIRVRLQSENGNIECWEKSENDKISAYVADDQSVIAEYSTSLKTEVIDRTEIDDPWAPPPVDQPE